MKIRLNTKEIIAFRGYGLTFLAFAALSLVLITTSRFARGQGTPTSGGKRWTAVQCYDGKTPPPLTLTDAYQLALQRLGNATDRLYCVSASCLEMTNNGFTGWTFRFSNTNGQRAGIDVFFDKEVYVGISSSELLRGK